MANEVMLLLPTLNEEKALKALANEIPDTFAVLVIDGGSADGTKAAAEALGYTFLQQKFGRGKGCGVRTGMEQFLQSGCQYLAMIDADYTNDPRELAKMVALLKDYDVALGSRDPQLQRELLGRFSLFINRSTSWLVSRAYRRDLPDIQTGYWAFSRRAVEALLPRLKAKGFEIEYDIVYSAWRLGLRIGWAPVTFRKRLGASKFTYYLRLKQIYYGLTYIARSLWLMALGAHAGDGARNEPQH